jgi:hypothetical protein
VLVVGGEGDGSIAAAVGTTEIYDPATGGWTATGSLHVPRVDFTATRLADDRVLVAGGLDNLDNSVTSIEIYDATSGTWTPGGFLRVPRFGHTASLLGDGRVLFAGGWIDDFFQWTTSSAELFDPVSGTTTGAAALAIARVFHTATVLADGQVLVAGGYRSDPPGGVGVYVPQTFSDTELYDPTTGSWRTTAVLSESREHHGATLLPDGSVLTLGGYGFSDFAYAPAQAAERYDPVADQWSVAGTPDVGVMGFTLTTLPSGDVLVTGGAVPMPDRSVQAVANVLRYTSVGCAP